MIYYSDNPAADYERYVADQEKALEQFPRCAGCGERIITEHLYKIGGEPFCEECIESCRMTVESYVG